MTSIVIVKIYRDLDPGERYERFHKPLDTALAAAEAGKVLGWGTLSDLDSDQTIYSDLQIEVCGDLDCALGVIRTSLVRCGAPSDTELMVEATGITVGLSAH